MNLPNGYRDETGTSYSDTWVHQDTKEVLTPSKRCFFNKEGWKEINNNKEYMQLIKGKFNQPSYTEWLKTK